MSGWTICGRSAIRLGGLTAAHALLAVAAASAAPQEPAAGESDYGPATRADECPSPPPVSESGVLDAVRYLADDALEGRLAGSAGERCAGDFIAAEFRRLGLRPAGEGDSYFQDLPLASAVNPHAPEGTGRNVAAILPGADPDLAAEVVVVGAHYDHLGRGLFGSLAPGDTGAIHNGADDNASGVAALLGAARQLAEGPALPRSVLFLAFTGEELGLLGSAHYVRQPTVALDSVVAMINLDMVGRLGADPLIVYGAGTAAEWPALLTPIGEVLDVELAFQQSGYGPSDHTSFYAREVPVLHFFTNVHGDYHKPSDDWEKIDAAGLEVVAALTAEVAMALAEHSGRLTVNPAPPPEPDRGGYGAYLGTVPDFAPVETGVRLSGVTGGSPADRAGLRAGDVIIAFDGEEIADLYGLTDALRAREPGDSVRITILRDEGEIVMTAVLGRRGDPSP